MLAIGGLVEKDHVVLKYPRAQILLALGLTLLDIFFWQKGIIKIGKI